MHMRDGTDTDPVCPPQAMVRAYSEVAALEKQGSKQIAAAAEPSLPPAPSSGLWAASRAAPSQRPPSPAATRAETLDEGEPEEEREDEGRPEEVPVPKVREAL